MDAIHHVLAYAAAACAIVGVGWSSLLVFRRRVGGPGFEQFQAVVVTVVLVEAASGLIQLSRGRPNEGLHLLYGLVAVALIPLARSFFGREGGRVGPVVLVVAFMVLGAVIFRLFSTG